MRSLVLFLAVVAFASTAHAGLFDAFRLRSNGRATVVRLPNVQKSATKFRVECGPNGCRRIEVK